MTKGRQDPPWYAKAVAMKQAGAKHREIADEFGVSIESVAYAVNSEKRARMREAQRARNRANAAKRKELSNV